MTVTLNQTIPDISVPLTTLQSGEYASFSLSEYRGKKIVLYFYPKDNTPGCTNESIAFRDAIDQFSALNTLIFGVSRDSLKSHDRFKEKLDLPFELIADTEELLCQQFDVIKQKMMYGKQVRGIERSTFIIDEQGQLVHEWRKVKVADHVNEVLKTVEAL
ncbi:peroxiredoxin [Formosimonas limnophila]|uniref:thioredoxin-dependent peroxiredoxin n=1 Tax=Formosimonas limnophila TaxID=1384487 RepID=A0A8J3FZ49_9BURK|nr:peroxiredoxin [Formosimonas limnophila]GHA65454.1 peroxiredoxin [Formosimonas limnophila]